MTFPIKRNDLEPSYAAKLVAGAADAPIDLTACSIKFLMTLQGATVPKVNAAATIDGDPTLGLVHYDWASGDTDTSGVYRVEWEITYPGARKRTVPSEGYAYIKVGDDLG